METPPCRLGPWMRRALLATALMNVFGALCFVPSITAGRELAGLPPAHPFYLWILAIWIGGFGLVYLWLGLTGSPDRAFLAIAAIGKLSFWALLLVYCLAGDLPALAPLLGLGDLFFGIIFVAWLWRARSSG